MSARFIDDDDAEVYGIIICDEDLEYNLVNLDYIPEHLVLDHTLSDHVPVRMNDGSIGLRFGRFWAAGSKSIYILCPAVLLLLYC